MAMLLPWMPIYSWILGGYDVLKWNYRSLHSGCGCYLLRSCNIVLMRSIATFCVVETQALPAYPSLCPCEFISLLAVDIWVVALKTFLSVWHATFVCNSIHFRSPTPISVVAFWIHLGNSSNVFRWTWVPDVILRAYPLNFPLGYDRA